MFISSFFLSFITYNIAHAHMMISLPSTWGRDSSLETPLNNGVTNWFCHGRTKDTNSFTTLNAGSSIDVPIICGEAIGQEENGAEVCSDDTAAYHGGGGCGLSIAYKENPSIDDFTMFSINVDCPNESESMITFEIPDNLPTGDAVCAWTWIPDRDFSAEEMYMNCFNCRVVGDSNGEITGVTQLVDHLWAVPYNGVGNDEDEDRGMYKDVFENGALSIQVDGNSTETEEPTETETDTETEEPTETETDTETEEPTETETDTGSEPSPTGDCTGEDNCSCSCCSKRSKHRKGGRRRRKNRHNHIM